MSFVTHLCVCNDAHSGADRVVEVVPSDFCVALRPGEECHVIAVGSGAAPSLTVVESAYGTHILCEAEATVTIEGPRTSKARWLTGAVPVAETDASPDRPCE